MVDLPNRLAWSADIGPRLRAAVASGAPLLVDCEMLAAGLAGVGVAVERLEGRGREWAGRIGGGVIAIGASSAALLDLLDLMGPAAGATGRMHRPAVILAMPPGLVGAAEAKARLAAAPMGAAYLTLRGRRGGSALAAAALTALLAAPGASPAQAGAG